MKVLILNTTLLDRDNTRLKREKPILAPIKKRLNPQRDNPLLLLPGGHSLAPLHRPKLPV